MLHYLRTYVPGGSYFFTVALLERHRRLLTEHVDALRAAFVSVRRQRPFHLDAIVVLPDHLHGLWTLPPDDADYSTRWRLIKAAFARTFAPGERLSDRRQQKGERGIWQRRFWEHAIRDRRDFERHFDYIHYNPVNMATSPAWRTGPIRAFTAAWKTARIRRIGRAIPTWPMRRALGNERVARRAGERSVTRRFRGTPPKAGYGLAP